VWKVYVVIGGFLTKRSCSKVWSTHSGPETNLGKQYFGESTTQMGSGSRVRRCFSDSVLAEQYFDKSTTQASQIHCDARRLADVAVPCVEKALLSFEPVRSEVGLAYSLINRSRSPCVDMLVLCGSTKVTVGNTSNFVDLSEDTRY
jgi:hypothetical protein